MRTPDPKSEWKAILLKIDPTTNPKAVDFVDLDQEGKPRDRSSAGIYKLDKDELTICVVLGPETKRPKEFKTGPGTNLNLDMMTLRRVKK